MKPLRISLTRLALLVAFLDLASPASAQVVTNNANSGAGSLRDTIAGASSGATITFTNTLSGANVILSWPVSADSFTLVSRSGVDTGLWAAVPQSPSTNNGVISVTLPLAPGKQFFRLYKP